MPTRNSLAAAADRLSLFFPSLPFTLRDAGHTAVDAVCLLLAAHLGIFIFIRISDVFLHFFCFTADTLYITRDEGPLRGRVIEIGVFFFSFGCTFGFYAELSATRPATF